MAVVWGQAFFTCVAVAMCVCALRRTFSVVEWLTPFLTAVLFIPLLPGSSGVANLLLSEGVAYPLFLVAISFLMRAVATSSLRCHLWFFFACGLLVLTRTQFLFLYPVGLACAIWRGVISRSLSAGVFVAFLLTACIFGTVLLEKTWNLYEHGEFTRPPFTGIQLVVAPLFIAEAEDVNLFDASAQRQFFEQVHGSMRENGWIWGEASRLGRGVRGEIFQYDNHYNEIAWGTVFPVARRLFAPSGGDSYDLPVLKAIDEGTVAVAVRLISAHPVQFIRFILYSILFGMGGYFAFIGFMLIFGASVVAILRTCAQGRERNPRVTVNGAAASCFFLLSAHFANGCLVALVEPVQTRYMIYTFTVSTCVLVVLAVNGLWIADGAKDA